MSYQSGYLVGGGVASGFGALPLLEREAYLLGDVPTVPVSSELNLSVPGLAVTNPNAPIYLHLAPAIDPATGVAPTGRTATGAALWQQPLLWAAGAAAVVLAVRSSSRRRR